MALKLLIDNWRWAGVPFYLRHGKRLPKRSSEIAIQFKPTPQLLFGLGDAGRAATRMCWRFAFSLTMASRYASASKVPGPGMHIRSVMMDFRLWHDLWRPSADAYERLMLDAMQGDATLFTRRDETEAAWTIVTSILDGWHHLPPPSSPTTRPAPGDHGRPATCWPARDAPGLDSSGVDQARWRARCSLPRFACSGPPSPLADDPGLRCGTCHRRRYYPG